MGPRRIAAKRAVAPQHDLPTLHAWLGRPHVAEHWGPRPSLEEVREKYIPRMEDPTAAKPYFAYLDGEAVGYVQVYPAVETDDGWWPGQHDPDRKSVV